LYKEEYDTEEKESYSCEDMLLMLCQKLIEWGALHKSKKRNLLSIPENGEIKKSRGAQRGENLLV
jgi:hypothetical protein